MQKTIKLNSLQIMIWLLISLTAISQQNIIVQNGTSKYHIVLPAQPNTVEQAAADELKSYIAQSTKASLLIVSENTTENNNNIYIGNTKAAHSLNITKNVKDDGFAIISKGSNLYISGKSGKGTLYGANRFLELCLDMDYLSATVIDVPSHSAVSVPQNINITSNPAFITRDDFTDMGFNGKWHNDTRDYSGGYKDWHCINHVFLDWDKESAWGLFGHSFFKLVPPQTYFASHPEYYSLIDGKRQAQQLNLSNPEVTDIVIRNVKQLIKNNSSQTYWMVGQEDVGKWCECADCQRAYQKYGGKQSGLLIEFINKIAKAFPDKQIATFAYHETEAPPQNIKPAVNVIIVSAPIDAHRNVPLNNPENAQQSNYIKQWKTLTNNQMIWDYYANFIDILAPFPDIAVYSPNFKWYQSMSIRHVFAQRPVFMPGSEMEELKAYLISKLLWNPQLNQDSIIASFTQKYYGDAGKYIVQYLKAMTANVAASKTMLTVQQNANDYVNAFLQPQYYKQYMAILDNAANAVKNNPELLNRVNNVRLATDFFIMKMIKTNNQAFLSAVNTALIPEAKTRFMNTVKRLNVKFSADASQQPIEPYLTVVSIKSILPKTLAACGFAACGMYAQRRLKRRRNKNKTSPIETA